MIIVDQNNIETLKEELLVLDEYVLLDLLQITMEDLIERFEDRIIEYHEEVQKAITV